MSSNASSVEKASAAAKGCNAEILKVLAEDPYGGRKNRIPHSSRAYEPFSVQDLARIVDVKRALEKVARLNPDLRDALWDWLVVGRSLHQIARDYKIGKETLVRAREVLRKELRDYDATSVSGGDT